MMDAVFHQQVGRDFVGCIVQARAGLDHMGGERLQGRLVGGVGQGRVLDSVH
ncbi:hypothetical protein D3C77_769050 [compost metagenome]